LGAGTGLRGVLLEVEEPGARVLGNLEIIPGGQRVTALGGKAVAARGVRVIGAVKGGLAAGVGFGGGLAEGGEEGMVLVGAAMLVMAAAPNSNPESAAGRYLMMSSLTGSCGLPA
jgi:hypothetical protein